MSTEIKNIIKSAEKEIADLVKYMGLRREQVLIFIDEMSIDSFAEKRDLTETEIDGILEYIAVARYQIQKCVKIINFEVGEMIENAVKLGASEKLFNKARKDMEAARKLADEIICDIEKSGETVTDDEVKWRSCEDLYEMEKNNL